MSTEGASPIVVGARGTPEEQRLYPVANEPASFQSPSHRKMRKAATPDDNVKEKQKSRTTSENFDMDTYKGTRIGMSSVMMPLFRTSPHHVDLMCPSKDEIDAEQDPSPLLVAEWLHVVPIYADRAGAHETGNVHPTFSRVHRKQVQRAQFDAAARQG